MQCGTCGNAYSDKDKVYLDKFNEITHQACSISSKHKDSGTYQEIINKYDFFKNLR